MLKPEIRESTLSGSHRHMAARKALIHTVNWHLLIFLGLYDVGEPHCHAFANRVFQLKILSFPLIRLSVFCVFFKVQLLTCLLWLAFIPAHTLP